MADAPLELREIPYLRLFPWVRLFRAVGVAFDVKKLILAALGVGLMIAGWGLIEGIFQGTEVTSLRFLGEPLPSPFDGRDNLAQTLKRAATTVTDPAMTLIEPFRAMFTVEPVPGAFWYALFASLWAAVVWGIIGGAIARIALVQVATGERVGMVAALRFSVRKAAPLVGAPLSPLIGVAFFAFLCASMGVFYNIRSQFVWSILGLLAFLPLLAGLVMAIILLGLAIGWPLMHATVAAEGEDAFDALSRSYAYVYQRPGHYAAYAALAWALGTIGVLVAGVFAQAVPVLAMWGLSFGGPDSLLVALFLGRPVAGTTTASSIHAMWLTFVYMLAYGWVYSYFWTTASIIYLLLRHDVDGTDWNDISQAVPEGQTVTAPLPTTATAAPPQATSPSPETPSSGPTDPVSHGPSS